MNAIDVFHLFQVLIIEVLLSLESLVYLLPKPFLYVWGLYNIVDYHHEEMAGGVSGCCQESAELVDHVVNIILLLNALILAAQVVVVD